MLASKSRDDTELLLANKVAIDASPFSSERL